MCLSSQTVSPSEARLQTTHLCMEQSGDFPFFVLVQRFSVYEALADPRFHLNSPQCREGGRARIKVSGSSYLPRQGFFRKENSGGEWGLVLWLLRPAAQQRLERQGQLGWGRVGGGWAEGARADGGHRRGSGLILDVSLSVGIWSALFISPSSISFAP